MKIFRRWVGIVRAVAVPTATALLVSSCGGDNTTPAPTPDSGNGDSTVEAAPDVQNQEAAPDSTVDGGLDGGGDSAADVSLPEEAGSEAGASDADAGSPAPTEAATPDAEAGAPPGADAGSADAAPDVVDNSAMYAFPGQVVTAICQQAATCCFGDASANFNLARCESDNLPTGFQGSSQGTAFLDGGNVVFNATKASACLADIASIDCRTNQLTSADMMALFPDCFGALQGTLALGAACKDSIECAPGEFCDPADGGATKTCQPLRTTDAGCGDFGTPSTPTSDQIDNAQSICSYRGSGNTGLVCEYEDRVTGNPLTTWSCVPSGALGGACSYHLDCTSRVCAVPAYQCGQATQFFNPTGCKYYQIGDGG